MLSSALQKRKWEVGKDALEDDSPASEIQQPAAAPSSVLRFVSSASIVADLAEKTLNSSLTTALAPLAYPIATTNRWLSSVAACPLKSDPDDYELLRIFLGAWHPALSNLSLPDVVGAWHVCHFLGKEEPVLHTLEADILQRFAVAQNSVNSDEMLSTAPGELKTRLINRWSTWVDKTFCDCIVVNEFDGIYGTALTGSPPIKWERSSGVLLNAIGEEFPGGIAPTEKTHHEVAAGLRPPNCAANAEIFIAASFGHLERLEKAVATGAPYSAPHLLYGAVAGEHKRVFDFIKNEASLTAAVWQGARGLACLFGRRASFSWCDEKHAFAPRLDDKLFSDAIQARDDGFLDWLGELNVANSPTAAQPAVSRKLMPGLLAWKAAALAKSVHAIDFLVRRVAFTPTQVTAQSAGILGAVQISAQLEQATLLQKLRPLATAAGLEEKIVTHVMAPLARRGHLSALQRLRATQPPYPWDACVVAEAAASCEMAIVEWLRSGDDPCPWDVSAPQACVRNGDRRILAYLQSNGCPLPADCSMFAWEPARK